MLIIFAISSALFVYSIFQMLIKWYTRKKDLRIKRLEVRNRALQQKLIIEQAFIYGHNKRMTEGIDENFYKYHLN